VYLPDHDESLESEEYVTGFAAPVHNASSSETADGKESLGDGVEVGALVVTLVDGEIRTGLSEVVLLYS
jgi:hypothetical protein